MNKRQLLQAFRNNGLTIEHSYVLLTLNGSSGLLTRLIFSKPRRSVIIINSYSYVLKINSQLVLKGIYVNALQTIKLHLVGSRITFNIYFFESTARNLVFQEIFEDEAQFFRY